MDDPRQDYWQSADETSRKRSGDCEDIAIWLYTRLKEAGCEDLELVIGRYRTIDSKLHMWVTYRDMEGETYILDPVIQKKPWKASFFGKGFYTTLRGAEKFT
jgi:predicted transglutaminase-like cysteine proteinase